MSSYFSFRNTSGSKSQDVPSRKLSTKAGDRLSSVLEDEHDPTTPDVRAESPIDTGIVRSNRNPNSGSTMGMISSGRPSDFQPDYANSAAAPTVPRRSPRRVHSGGRLNGTSDDGVSPIASPGDEFRTPPQSPPRPRSPVSPIAAAPSPSVARSPPALSPASSSPAGSRPHSRSRNYSKPFNEPLPSLDERGQSLDGAEQRNQQHGWATGAAAAGVAGGAAGAAALTSDQVGKAASNGNANSNGAYRGPNEKSVAFQDDQSNEKDPGHDSSEEESGRPSHAMVVDDESRGWSGPVSLGHDRRSKRRRHEPRGGWGRVLVILGIITVIVIGLAVGLGVGLTRGSGSSGGSNDSGSNSGSNPSGGDENADFPLGTWSFPTLLTNSSSACTTNSLIWTCPPPIVYTGDSANAGASKFTFNWEISSSAPSSSPNNNSLSIASTSNSLTLQVPSTHLTLVDEGQADERFEFTISLAKTVTPSSAITPDGATTLCYWNSTTLIGALYTRMKPSLPINVASTSIGAGDIAPGSMQWPGAVFLQQTSPLAGANNADCFPASGTTVTGAEIDAASIAPGTGTGECECVWESSTDATY